VSRLLAGPGADEALRCECAMISSGAAMFADDPDRFADWIRFACGMSVKLACDRGALDAWWRAVSQPGVSLIARDHITVCEAFK